MQHKIAELLRRLDRSPLFWRLGEYVIIGVLLVATGYYSWYWGWTGFAYAALSFAAGIFIVSTYGDIIPGFKRRDKP